MSSTQTVHNQMTLKAAIYFGDDIMKLINFIKSLLKTERIEASTHDKEVLAELEGENKAFIFSK